MKKYFKIIRKKDGVLVGLSHNSLDLEGYRIEEINEMEYSNIQIELWQNIQNSN